MDFLSIEHLSRLTPRTCYAATEDYEILFDELFISVEEHTKWLLKVEWFPRLGNGCFHIREVLTSNHWMNEMKFFDTDVWVRFSWVDKIERSGLDVVFRYEDSTKEQVMKENSQLSMEFE